MQKSFVEEVVDHLIGVMKGQNPISDKMIDEETDIHHKEILTGILTLQEDLQYANAQKEKAFREIEKSNLALIEAKKKEEAASKAKIEFLSFISHEIRSPLNAVIGLTHILLTDNPRKSQIQDLQALRLSAKNLLSLINELLDLNKIEANMVELDNEVFCINEIVDTVVRSFHFSANEKGLSLRVKISECIPEKLMGDQIRFAQILNNLISNAIKFTEKGYVSVNLELIRCIPGAVVVGLTVADSGIGIDKKRQQLVFDRYIQENKDISRKYGGTGLGLAITSKLVELFHGTINLESNKGKGTIFKLTLKFKTAA